MMDVKEAMDQRISLRAYNQKPIEQEKLSQLQEAIDVANAQMAEAAPDHPAILTIEGPQGRHLRPHEKQVYCRPHLPLRSRLL